MGSFLQLYLARLKSHPISTNLGSALLLMTVGDGMAQELEKQHLSALEKDDDVAPSSRRWLSFSRYGGSHFHPHHHHLHGDEEHRPPGPPSVVRYDGEESSSNWHVAVAIVADWLRHELRDVDPIRTASMGLWSVGFYAPAYMWLYTCYDRFFPRKTTATIAWRVLGSLAFSIPVNACFFCYGTCVHHTVEWFSKWEEWKHTLDHRQSDQNDEVNTREVDSDEVSSVRETACTSTTYDQPKFHATAMLSKAKLKIESELAGTIATSAKMWIPINVVNFSLVPSHLRPVSLFFASLFWNCYLSLVQHRDVAVPEEFELDLDVDDMHVMLDEEQCGPRTAHL